MRRESLTVAPVGERASLSTPLRFCVSQRLLTIP